MEIVLLVRHSVRTQIREKGHLSCLLTAEIPQAELMSEFCSSCLKAFEFKHKKFILQRYILSGSSTSAIPVAVGPMRPETPFGEVEFALLSRGDERVPVYPHFHLCLQDARSKVCLPSCCNFRRRYFSCLPFFIA